MQRLQTGARWPSARLRDHAVPSGVVALAAGACLASWLGVALAGEAVLAATGPVVILIACRTVERPLAVTIAGATATVDAVLASAYANDAEDLVFCAILAVAALFAGLALLAPGRAAAAGREVPEDVAPVLAPALEAALAEVRHRLSHRQEQVLSLTLRGLSARQIAAHLDIGLRTVETHLSAGYRKLGVHSRAELTTRLLGHSGLAGGRADSE